MDIFNRSIMHAAGSTRYGVERRFKESTEDRRADAAPIELRVVGGVEQEVMRNFAVDGRDIGSIAEKITVDVRELFQLRAEILIATVDGLIEDREEIDQGGAAVVGSTEVVGELILIEYKRVLRIKTEHQPDTELG